MLGSRPADKPGPRKNLPHGPGRPHITIAAQFKPAEVDKISQRGFCQRFHELYLSVGYTTTGEDRRLSTGQRTITARLQMIRGWSGEDDRSSSAGRDVTPAAKCPDKYRRGGTTWTYLVADVLNTP